MYQFDNLVHGFFPITPRFSALEQAICSFLTPSVWTKPYSGQPILTAVPGIRTRELFSKFGKQGCLADMVPTPTVFSARR